MYRLFGIFAILTLLCISSTSGHDINYQFTSISVAEGLSQSTAQSILLDKKGKLWIGTKNGLNSYNIQKPPQRQIFLTKQSHYTFNPRFP